MLGQTTEKSQGSMPLIKDAETTDLNSTTTIVGGKQIIEESILPAEDVEKSTWGAGEKDTNGGPEVTNEPRAPPPATFPDGGFVAWSQVAMGFLIMFSTW